MLYITLRVGREKYLLEPGFVTNNNTADFGYNISTVTMVTGIYCIIITNK